MSNEKKGSDEEEKGEVFEAPETEKPEETKEESPKSEEKADDRQTDEKDEDKKSVEVPKDEEKSEESKSEEEPKDETPETPQLSEAEQLRAENLTLKTQLEALKIGFKPDCLDDAVILAENIVKREGTDISAALQAVAKKYPDWKAGGEEGKVKGGFKIGADSSDGEKKTDESKLSRAFGIKKRK